MIVDINRFMKVKFIIHDLPYKLDLHLKILSFFFFKKKKYINNISHSMTIIIL